MLVLIVMQASDTFSQKKSKLKTHLETRWTITTSLKANIKELPEEYEKIMCSMIDDAMKKFKITDEQVIEKATPEIRKWITTVIGKMKK